MELFFKLVLNKILRTRVFRHIIVFIEKRKKNVIVIRNVTNKKLFLLRRRNDFSQKKAVRLQPNQIFNIIFRKEEIFVHDGERIVHTICKPVFEIVISNDDEINRLVFTQYH